MENFLEQIQLNNQQLLTALIGTFLFLVIGFILMFTFRSRRSRKRKVQPSPPQAAQVVPAAVAETGPEEAFGLQLIEESGHTNHLKSLPVTLGRSSDNQIQLSDDSVSASHARIYYDELSDEICIEDLDSLNGLFLNGQPTRKNLLYDGVKITLGSVNLTFRNTGYIHPRQ